MVRLLLLLPASYLSCDSSCTVGGLSVSLAGMNCGEGERAGLDSGRGRAAGGGDEEGGEREGCCSDSPSASGPAAAQR